MTGENQTVKQSRITVEEISARLALGEVAVYRMLQDGTIPALRVGRRWIVTRESFENWVGTCGQRSV